MENTERKVREDRPKRKKSPSSRPHSSRPQQGGKKRRKKKKSNGTGCLIAVIIFAVLVIALMFAGYNLIKADMSTGEELTEISVSINEGTSVPEIADLLEEEGVIDNSLHFRVLAKLNSQGAEFKSGCYKFTNNMNFYEIVEKLNSGAVDESAIKLLVKEGQWLSEIAETVDELGICTEEEFLEAANSRDYNYDFVQQIPERKNLLEGYLYPNTYFVSEGMTARDVVDMLLGEFQKQIDKNGIVEKAENIGKSLDDIVKIASLIEAEVKYEPERALVSSVIHNRLNTNTKLQIDASVLYSIGERRTRVYYKDLKIEDGHNTYYVDGLPVGPINSPRIESIIAACEPADTDYMFYVVEDTQTGQHAFCETYEEFERAKEKYLAQVD